MNDVEREIINNDCNEGMNKLANEIAVLRSQVLIALESASIEERDRKEVEFKLHEEIQRREAAENKIKELEETIMQLTLENKILRESVPNIRKEIGSEGWCDWYKIEKSLIEMIETLNNKNERDENKIESFIESKKQSKEQVLFPGCCQMIDPQYIRRKKRI